MPGYARPPETIASGVSVTPAGTITSTNVQSALVELDTDIVSNDSNDIKRAIYTAKGDLVTASASSAPIRLAVGTNGQVLTASSTATGGLVWAPATAGATGGGTDQVFYNNDQSVTTNYSIPSGKNSMTAGPVTINNGVTVTIPNNSVWVIV